MEPDIRSFGEFNGTLYSFSASAVTEKDNGFAYSPQNPSGTSRQRRGRVIKPTDPMLLSFSWWLLEDKAIFVSYWNQEGITRGIFFAVTPATVLDLYDNRPQLSQATIH